MDELLQPAVLGPIGVIFLFSYLISYAAIPIIIRIAREKHLFDHPDDNRKLHSEAIPTFGGIAIFAGFLVSFSISPWANSLSGYSYLAAALLILFFIGLKDDLVVLSAPKKLLAQLSAAGLIIFGSDMVIDNFYGVLGLAEIPSWLAIPITFFSVIVLINSVNLIDGIDGLAGGIGVIISSIFGGVFLYMGELPMAMFSFCLVGALLGFLYYNFSPASIFMGDTGSMLLGFLLAVQTIRFISLGGRPDFTSIVGNSSAILAIALLVFPLYDTLRVVFKRFRRNRSIFKPGQDHVHHELLRMGCSHQDASLILYGNTLLIVAVIGTLSLFGINANILLGVLIMLSLLVFPTNGFKRNMLSKVFGYNWQVYRMHRWDMGHALESIDATRARVGSPNESGEEYSHTKKEEFDEEIEKIAV